MLDGIAYRSMDEDGDGHMCYSGGAYLRLDIVRGYHTRTMFCANNTVEA